MSEFYVFETWVRMRIVEAEDTKDAYNRTGVPEPVPSELGFTLANWFVAPVNPVLEDEETEQ